MYVTVNSICWSLVQKQDYIVNEWKYHGIDYPDGKKMQITDILNTVSLSIIILSLIVVMKTL